MDLKRNGVGGGGTRLNLARGVVMNLNPIQGE